MSRGRPRKMLIGSIRVEREMRARPLQDSVVAEYAEALERGEVLPAVVVFVDGDGEHWLSDGHHRVAAHRQLNRPQVSVQVQRGTRDDAIWYGLGANRTHGLRLTAADREAAIRRALHLRPQASNRAIAVHVGADHKTVAKYRTELRSGGEIPHLKEHEGRDGKVYRVDSSHLDPTRYSQFDDPPDDDPPPDLEDKTPPAAVVDKVGQVIPNDRVAEAFRRDSELTKVCTALSQMKVAILESIEKGDSLYADLTASQVQVDFDNLRNAIRLARPYAVCPYCGGDGATTRCKACHGRGWCNKATWDHRPDKGDKS